jgi:hypothetical protein
LQGIVADADRLLQITQDTLARVPRGSEQEKRIRQAAELLLQLLSQDIDREGDDGPSLKQGVAKDRILSVHDPEMRYGHKSSSNRFEGHTVRAARTGGTPVRDGKLAIAADPETQLITAVDVLPRNANDSAPALDLVKQSEDNTGMPVEETIADCAFGDGATREEFEQAGRRLVAKVPRRPNAGLFPKATFDIDLQAMTCTCPAGQVTEKLVGTGRTKPRTGEYEKGHVFQFEAAVCEVCHLRAQCTRAGPGKGRTVNLHPQERLLQQARALQASPDFKRYQRMRQVGEHRLARMVQLGVRKARFFGRTKTLFQALMAAAVANFTLIAGKTRQTELGRSARRAAAFLLSRCRTVKNSLFQHWTLRMSLTNLHRLISSPWEPGFRPNL